MVLAVSDADVLIHLAKLDILDFLVEQFSKIYISDIIYNESIVEGKRFHKKDALILEEYLKKELFTIESVAGNTINKRTKIIRILNLFNICICSYLQFI